MNENKDLIDPMGAFIKAVCKSARIRGEKIAGEHFEGDMAIVMGEVFGDFLSGGVICAVGNSLWNSPKVEER